MLIVNKTLKIIQSHQEPNLWKNLIKCYISLYKKKYKKINIGKILVLYLLVLIVQVKVNIKSWNGSDQIKINSKMRIAIVFMVQMLILLC